MGIEPIGTMRPSLRTDSPLVTDCEPEAVGLTACINQTGVLT